MRAATTIYYRQLSLKFFWARSPFFASRHFRSCFFRKYSLHSWNSTTANCNIISVIWINCIEFFDIISFQSIGFWFCVRMIEYNMLNVIPPIFLNSPSKRITSGISFAIAPPPILWFHASLPNVSFPIFFYLMAINHIVTIPWLFFLWKHNKGCTFFIYHDTTSPYWLSDASSTPSTLSYLLHRAGTYLPNFIMTFGC